MILSDLLLGEYTAERLALLKNNAVYQTPSTVATVSCVRVDMGCRTFLILPIMITKLIILQNILCHTIG
jgi:hypothetical protein